MTLARQPQAVLWWPQRGTLVARPETYTRALVVLALGLPLTRWRSLFPPQKLRGQVAHSLPEKIAALEGQAAGLEEDRAHLQVGGALGALCMLGGAGGGCGRAAAAGLIPSQLWQCVVCGSSIQSS